MNLSLPSENITPGDIPSLSKWELCKLPGAPQIPVRNYEILLPPNIDPQSIKIDIINDISVESNGEYNISPALFPVAYLKEEMAIDNSINFSNAYEENALWPAEFIQLSGKHQIRDASIVDIRFYPAQYNPITKKVMEHKNCLISISWDDITKKKPIDSLTLSFLSNFGENIDNFAEMLPYYVTSKASNDIPDTTYVIVTTNNIKLNSEKIDNFVRYKQASGFKVMVITEDDYGVDLGKQRALNIRNWLQNHYVSDSIEYVLLIGDPDPDDETSSSDSMGDLPMLMC
ncbi:MAG: C25 family peptidase propeptide domain-containing protein [Promethearchaeota archaeon]